MQIQVEGVVNPGALALHAHTRPDRFGNTKEHQCLVHQVRSQIKEHSSARPAVLPPGVQPGQLTKAIVVRFKHDQPSQPVAFQQLAYGQEVAIPAPVLVTR